MNKWAFGASDSNMQHGGGCGGEVIHLRGRGVDLKCKKTEQRSDASRMHANKMLQRVEGRKRWEEVSLSEKKVEEAATEELKS